MTSSQPQFNFLASLYPYYHCSFDAPCNLNCFFCYERPHGEPAQAERLRTIGARLNVARHAGYEVMVFGSGELVLHPEWEKLIRLAVWLGFRRVGVLSNLTMLTAEVLQRFKQLGVTDITGTITAADEDAAAQITGRPGVLSRQLEALARMGAQQEMSVYLHLVVTSSLQERLLEHLQRLNRLLGDQPRVMVSGIEPSRPETPAHPQFTAALSVAWPDLLDQAREAGVTVMTQNIPACVLRHHAHSSWTLRRRAAQALAGWPRDPKLAHFINSAERFTVKGGTSPQACPLELVCDRVGDCPASPSQQLLLTHEPDEVVRAMLRDGGRVGTSREVDQVITALRWINRQREPARGGPPLLHGGRDSADTGDEEDGGDVHA